MKGSGQIGAVPGILSSLFPSSHTDISSTPGTGYYLEYAVMFALTAAALCFTSLLELTQLEREPCSQHPLLFQVSTGEEVRPKNNFYWSGSAKCLSAASAQISECDPEAHLQRLNISPGPRRLATSNPGSFLALTSVQHGRIRTGTNKFFCKPETIQQSLPFASLDFLRDPPPMFRRTQWPALPVREWDQRSFLAPYQRPSLRGVGGTAACVTNDASIHW